MQKYLNHIQLQLLRDVIGRRCPELRDRIQNSDISNLNRHERDLIVHTLALEFAEDGVGEDSTPNQKGLKIEALIDFINRPNLFGDE